MNLLTTYSPHPSIASSGTWPTSRRATLGHCAKLVARTPSKTQYPLRRSLLKIKSAADDGQSDRAPELSARDIAMNNELRNRISEIESRPFYAGLIESAKNEGLSRRVLFGGLAAASLSFALFSGVGQDKETKALLPLSYYISEVLACDLALKQAKGYASDGEWIQFNTLRRRISDGATKKSLQGVVSAAKLTGRDADKARTISQDFLELVDQMDYARYINSLPVKINSDEYTKLQEDRRKKEFTFNATVAAELKLQELISMLPQNEVQYALSGGANGSLGSSGTVLSPASL